MKFFLRSSIFILLTVATTAALGYFFLNKPAFNPVADRSSFIRSLNDGSEKRLMMKLQLKAKMLRKFSQGDKYNNQYCFLIDMTIEPGKYRFFVYNMAADSVELAGLVTHGSGLSNSGLRFSNEPGSYCTSIGKYKIGNSYSGNFGLAYKLHGLDKTNSNAYKRYVVLHAHSCVPEDEIYPLSICESQGCPTVSPAFLKKLTQYIDGSSTPILLWIYN